MNQLERLARYVRMSYHKKGQVIVPTGGGKTMCMIGDQERDQASRLQKNFVGLHLRILLAQQFLEQITGVNISCITSTHLLALQNQRR